MNISYLSLYRTLTNYIRCKGKNIFLQKQLFMGQDEICRAIFRESGGGCFSCLHLRGNPRGPKLRKGNLRSKRYKKQNFFVSCIFLFFPISNSDAYAMACLGDASSCRSTIISDILISPKSRIRARHGAFGIGRGRSGSRRGE